MASHVLFLRWWLLVLLTVIGLTLSNEFGVYQLIWDSDVTKLSFLILAVFGVMSAWCGFTTWKLSKSFSDGHLIQHSSEWESLEHSEDAGWFVSDILLTLGMIGTVFGFIIMLSGGFDTVDVADPKSIQLVLSKLTVGLGTALYTTLVGLISSALLKLQYFNLTKGMDRLRGDSHEE